MAIYAGERTMDGIKVTVDGEPLDERFDLERHTDSWFEWGYPGGSPKQLALAILAHHLDDPERAKRLAEPFMREVVAVMDNDWQLASEEVDDAVRRIEQT